MESILEERALLSGDLSLNPFLTLHNIVEERDKIPKYSLPSTYLEVVDKALIIIECLPQIFPPEGWERVESFRNGLAHSITELSVLFTSSISKQLVLGSFLSSSFTPPPHYTVHYQ